MNGFVDFAFGVTMLALAAVGLGLVWFMFKAFPGGC